MPESFFEKQGNQNSDYGDYDKGREVKSQFIGRKSVCIGYIHPQENQLNSRETKTPRAKSKNNICSFPVINRITNTARKSISTMVRESNSPLFLVILASFPQLRQALFSHGIVGLFF